MAGNFQITATEDKVEILLRLPGSLEWIDISGCVKGFKAIANEYAEVTLVGIVSTPHNKRSAPAQDETDADNHHQ